jgi:hypothetical protein
VVFYVLSSIKFKYTNVVSFHKRNILIFIIILLFWLFSYLGPESKLTDGFSNAIRSDGLGYFSWTQFFMGNDTLCFDKMRKEFEIYSPQNSWVIKPIENSKCFLPIYPMGLGILLIPFYVLASLITYVSISAPVNPYALPFQVLISMSGSVFIAIGLIFFTKTINRFFETSLRKYSHIIAILMLLGSNLLHYSTYDGIFSHASSFMINSIIIYSYLCIEKEKNASVLYYFLLGFLPIFGTVIRPTNITMAILSILIVHQLIKKRKITETIYFMFGLIIALQFLLYQFYLWNKSTGNYLYFTYYSYEGFKLQPELILQIIFSFNPHGLLPWSPIILLSLLGAVKAFRFSKNLFLSSVVIFALNALIFSSWSQPFGGGAFGNRLFIDLYPLFFISLACVYTFSNRFFKSSIYVYSVMSSILTMYLTYLYWKGQIDFGGLPFKEYGNKVQYLPQFLGTYEIPTLFNKIFF